jgi:hypothetical protein
MTGGKVGATAARISVMERRDVREAVVFEMWLVAGFAVLSAIALAPESLPFVALASVALALLGLLAFAWRRGARRHPHVPAFAIGVLIMVVGTTAALTASSIAEMMIGMFAVGVVGNALLMPWRAAWHRAFLGMAAASYVAGVLLASPLAETQRVTAFLVGLAAVSTSAVGNVLTIRRRHRRWEVELSLRTQRVELRQTVARLQAAQNRIERLEGILPICAHCKRIRHGQEWHAVEHYVASRSEAQFSHGICPDCLRTHYSDYVTT